MRRRCGHARSAPASSSTTSALVCQQRPRRLAAQQQTIEVLFNRRDACFERRDRKICSRLAPLGKSLRRELLILCEEPPCQPAQRRTQQEHDAQEGESERTWGAEPLADHDGAAP
jgi:hypothetical protein